LGRQPQCSGANLKIVEGGGIFEAHERSETTGKESDVL